MDSVWAPGEVIVRREVLGMTPVAPPSPAPSWFLRPRAAIPVYVVEDHGDEFVAYIPPDAELGFVDGT